MSVMRSRNSETTSKLPLTARQREALEFIRRCVRKRGYEPTVREIGDQMGINSPNGVVGHLVALERKGFIHREANLSRSIMLVERGEKTATGLLLLAHVTGKKIVDNPQLDERIDLTEKIQLNGEDFFLLRVQDDLLAQYAISQGDLLLVRRARTAARDETVILRTPENDFLLATCEYDPLLAKTFIKTLQSNQKQLENSCSAIYGVLVAVVRTF
ncbi:MAG: hypothetical protein Q4D62_16370 [Planctomycetia bacterium]|nr:hypothetical protein [Planctomycetia bacterium]